MRTLVAVFIGFSAAGWAADTAALSGVANGHCDGANHVVTVSGLYDEVADGGLTGLVFVRDAIGFCTPPVTVPAEPLPLLPVAGEFSLTYTATAVLPAPAEAAVFRYMPYAVRSDGSLEPLATPPQVFSPISTLVACVDAPLLRGTVTLDLPNLQWCGICYTIEPCPGDCWTEVLQFYLDGPTLESLTGESASDLLGSVVDVFGTNIFCTMPVCASFTITDIERAEDGGCGSVPVAGKSWGGLKATYR